MQNNILDKSLFKSSLIIGGAILFCIFLNLNSDNASAQSSQSDCEFAKESCDKIATAWSARKKDLQTYITKYCDGDPYADINQSVWSPSELEMLKKGAKMNYETNCTFGKNQYAQEEKFNTASIEQCAQYIGSGCKDENLEPPTQPVPPVNNTVPPEVQKILDEQTQLMSQRRCVKSEKYFPTSRINSIYKKTVMFVNPANQDTVNKYTAMTQGMEAEMAKTYNMTMELFNLGREQLIKNYNGDAAEYYKQSGGSLDALLKEYDKEKPQAPTSSGSYASYTPPGTKDWETCNVSFVAMDFTGGGPTTEAQAMAKTKQLMQQTILTSYFLFSSADSAQKQFNAPMKDRQTITVAEGINFGSKVIKDVKVSGLGDEGRYYVIYASDSGFVMGGHGLGARKGSYIFSVNFFNEADYSKAEELLKAAVASLEDATVTPPGVTLPPPAPLDIIVSPSECSVETPSVTIKWDAVTPPEGVTASILYRVYREGSSTPLNSSGLTGTSYTDKAVERSKSYTYFVKAYYVVSGVEIESASSVTSSPALVPEQCFKDKCLEPGSMKITSYTPKEAFAGKALPLDENYYENYISRTVELEVKGQCLDNIYSFSSDNKGDGDSPGIEFGMIKVNLEKTSARVQMNIASSAKDGPTTIYVESKEKSKINLKFNIKITGTQYLRKKFSESAKQGYQTLMFYGSWPTINDKVLELEKAITIGLSFVKKNNYKKLGVTIRIYESTIWANGASVRVCVVSWAGGCASQYTDYVSIKEYGVDFLPVIMLHELVHKLHFCLAGEYNFVKQCKIKTNFEKDWLVAGNNAIPPKDCKYLPLTSEREWKGGSLSDPHCGYIRAYGAYDTIYPDRSFYEDVATMEEAAVFYPYKINEIINLIKSKAQLELEKQIKDLERIIALPWVQEKKEEAYKQSLIKTLNGKREEYDQNYGDFTQYQNYYINKLKVLKNYDF